VSDGQPGHACGRLAGYGRDCQIVGNGVDLARFLQTPVAAGAALRARLGIAPSAPLVVSIGGGEPRKNTDRMLTASMQARAVRSDLRWVIAGGASIFDHAAYRAAFAERLTKVDQASRDAILQVGVISEADLGALLRAADVLMHASLHEGFGLAVLEAMASDARVVVSRGEPLDEFVDDACAVRVRADDHEEIFRGLLVALNDDAATRARVRARCEAHAWSRCAERHELAYAGTGDRAI
jgi:glycosyltransferase involved in cell wall biosynthesis